MSHSYRRIVPAFAGLLLGCGSQGVEIAIPLLTATPSPSPLPTLAPTEAPVTDPTVTPTLAPPPETTPTPTSSPGPLPTPVPTVPPGVTPTPTITPTPTEDSFAEARALYQRRQSLLQQATDP